MQHGHPVPGAECLEAKRKTCFSIKSTPGHRRSSECGVNAFGRSSSSVHRASRPSRVTLTTSMCGENSSRTWRHMPHGGVGSSASVAITIVSKLRLPRATAADTALRSRANAGGKRGVLDVAAFADAAVRRQQRGADPKVRVWRVRALHRGEGSFAEDRQTRSSAGDSRPVAARPPS